MQPLEPTNFARIQELLTRVLVTPERDREQYLEEACSNDPALRLEVEKLLKRYRQDLGQDDSRDVTQPFVRDVDLSPCPERIGSYPIVCELGRGGMGVVYQATDPKLKREIALKVLPHQATGGADRLARFEREAQLLASLNHPNIATIHSLEEFEGTPFLTLELVAGDTLSKRIRRGPLAIDVSLSVVHQVTLALEAAHKRQIIHRDLKPGNIMVTPEGQVKVLDFGLAKALRPESTAMANPSEASEDTPDGLRPCDPRVGQDEPSTVALGTTREGAILGTPGYMSPEQLQGQSGDHRVDLWALGCVLFECMSAQRTFPGNSPQEVALATLQAGPDWSRLPAETPERVRTLLTKCLAKNVQDRLDSATEARRMLEEAIARGPGGINFSGYRRGRIAEWSSPRYQLDREFVALTLLVDQGQESASGRWSARPGRYQDLRAVLAAVEDPVLVLLGPPGSGKSTLLRRLELDMAETALKLGDGRPEHQVPPGDGERDPITFFLQLNHYRAANPGDRSPDPRAWLSERWQARFPELPSLESLLDAGRMVLLLDALNEMPVANTAELRDAVLRWKEFLQRLVTEHPGNRVLFSCRTLDYSAPLSSPALPVPQVVIESLQDGQVEQFVIKHSPKRGEFIWNELKGTPQLEVMRSPYFLSLLVHQVETKGEIPKGRAELITGFVRQALRREVGRDNPLFAPDALLTERDVRRITQWKWDATWDLPERGLLVRKLSELAYGMQDRSEGGGASQVRIDFDEALSFLDDEQDEAIVRAGIAISVLDEDPVHDELLFFHQLLQEYFAGRHLARRPEPERVRAAWRTAEIRPPLGEVLERLPPTETLPELPTTGWEETALLAGTMTSDPKAYVRGLMETHLALAGRCAAQLEVRSQLSPELLDRLRWALVERSQDGEAELRARIAAGLTLGLLGDPRFDRRSGPHGPYLLPPMVESPGGWYPLGDDDAFEAESVKWDQHVPRHEMEFASFRIGRYLVTNAEWMCFQESGGYEDERWWDTEAARAWRSGDGTAEGQRREWKGWWEHLREHPELLEAYRTDGRIDEELCEAWRQRLKMTETEFEVHVRERFPGGKLREPVFWRDDRYNNPSQPVVGVSWYEARAYANWIASQLDEPYRLPTEAEWEVVARGREARVYCWGDEFDPLLGNTRVTKLRRTTPVGVFVGGMTPEGACDLTGNVAEWTGSVFGNGNPSKQYRYPYRPRDGREDPHAGSSARRVLRGGGWDINQVFSRAACRFVDHPENRNAHIGFRLTSGGSTIESETAEPERRERRVTAPPSSR